MKDYFTNSFRVPFFKRLKKWFFFKKHREIKEQDLRREIDFAIFRENNPVVCDLKERLNKHFYNPDKETDLC